MSIEFWIKPSIAYRNNALFGKHRLNPEAGRFFSLDVTFSRYVGIVRLKDKSFGSIDVILDVTNTTRHTNVSLVLGRSLNDEGVRLIEKLAGDFRARFTIST